MIAAPVTQLAVVQSKLKIPEKVMPPKRDSSITPTEVLRSIVQANRQLNLLLDRRFTPSDVFERVTQAIGYASVLLAEFPMATRIPPPPDFKRKKRPADVYRLLSLVYQSIREVGQISGEKMLRFELKNGGLDSVAPSDVYDIASLLVSELTHLYQQSSTTRMPPRSFYPGRKTPSHVYQRAGILQKQLELLVQLVKKNPQWLKKK